MTEESARRKEGKGISSKKQADAELSAKEQKAEKSESREELPKMDESGSLGGENDSSETDVAEFEEEESETEVQIEDAEVIESLKKELAKKENKYLRLQAELENFKKRSAQEIKRRFKYAGQGLALSMLSGLDSLERALEQAKEEENEQMKEFITGIEMVRQQFYEALKEHNIVRTFPVNEPFDPNLHEAMGVIETDETEPDHISLVFQAGYMYHDRVIRPAVVQVAKKK